MITQREKKIVIWVLNTGSVNKTFQGWHRRLSVLPFDWLVILCRYFNQDVCGLMGQEFYMKQIKGVSKCVNKEMTEFMVHNRLTN